MNVQGQGSEFSRLTSWKINQMVGQIREGFATLLSSIYSLEFVEYWVGNLFFIQSLQEFQEFLILKVHFQYRSTQCPWPPPLRL